MDERPYQENQGRGRDAALVLGILSIIFIFICQLVGLVLGIIGLHKTRKDRNGGTDTA